MTFEDREDFLRRWSRRKREAAEKESAPPAAGDAPAKADPAPTPAAEGSAGAPAVPPPLEGLSPESDFRAFMDETVDPRTRNAALKKLFADPRFNVIDPLDIDIDDYSQLERLPEAVVKTLAHARSTLLGPRESRAGEDPVEAQAPVQVKEDVAQRTATPQEPPREAARNDAADPGAEESGTGEAQDRDGNQG